MRYHTSHLIGAVVLAAVACAIMRYPQSLVAVLVPLVGGMLVVLPVLGTIELLSSRVDPMPRIGWGATFVVLLVAVAGSVAAIVLGLALAARP